VFTSEDERYTRHGSSFQLHVMNKSVPRRARARTSRALALACAQPPAAAWRCAFCRVDRRPRSSPCTHTAGRRQHLCRKPAEIACVGAHARAFNAAPPALWNSGAAALRAGRLRCLYPLHQITHLHTATATATSAGARARTIGLACTAGAPLPCGRRARPAGPARASSMPCRCACMSRAVQTCREST
jgi:hypothetical protein